MYINLMSLDAKQLKINSLTISSDSNSIKFNTTRKLSLTTSTPINASNKFLLTGQTLSNLNSINSAINNDITLESKTSSSVIFNQSSTADNEVEFKSDGIAYLNDLPLITLSTRGIANGGTDMINGRSFHTTDAFSFTPNIYGVDSFGAKSDTVVKSSQLGYYNRVGNIVFFNAKIVCSNVASITTSDRVQITLPINIPYSTTSPNYPQSIIINNSTSYRSSTVSISDITAVISNSPGAALTNINYAELFIKTGTGSINQTFLQFADISNTYEISYGGWYYIFP